MDYLIRLFNRMACGILGGHVPTWQPFDGTLATVYPVAICASCGATL